MELQYSTVVWEHVCSSEKTDPSGRRSRRQQFNAFSLTRDIVHSRDTRTIESTCHPEVSVDYGVSDVPGRSEAYYGCASQSRVLRLKSSIDRSDTPVDAAAMSRYLRVLLYNTKYQVLVWDRKGEERRGPGALLDRPHDVIDANLDCVYKAVFRGYSCFLRTRQNTYNTVQSRTVTYVVVLTSYEIL